jgi:flagellar basal body rod protein FlgB
MNLSALVTDNITEILIRIVKFTQTRHKVLIQNIINIRNPEFVPKELEVNEFSNLLSYAVDEHVRNQRLILSDTENIKFDAGGRLEVKPVVDELSKKLFKENREKYLERQMDKLWENSLNQKLAAELLRQKQGAFSFNKS